MADLKRKASIVLSPFDVKAQSPQPTYFNCYRHDK